MTSLEMVDLSVQMEKVTAMQAQIARHIKAQKFAEIREIVKSSGLVQEVIDDFIFQINEAEAAVAEVKKQAAEAPKPKVEKAKGKRTYTVEETRRNAAKVVAKYEGFDEARKALETDLPDDIDGREASRIGNVLAEAMKATRPEDGKWVFHSWVRDAMRVHRDTAWKLGSESLVMLFLINLLNALKVLSNEKVSNDMLNGAQMNLEKAKPVNEWAPWALSAVDRLIRKGKLHPWDGCNRAEDFIARLHQEVSKGIQHHREENDRRKKAKDSSRRANQVARAEDCRKRSGK